MVFLLLNPPMSMNNEMSVKLLGNKICYSGLCNVEKFVSSKILDLFLAWSNIHIIVIKWKKKRKRQKYVVVSTVWKIKSRNIIGMEVAYHFTFSALFKTDPWPIWDQSSGNWQVMVALLCVSLTCEIHKKGIHRDKLFGTNKSNTWRFSQIQKRIKC